MSLAAEQSSFNTSAIRDEADRVLKSTFPGDGERENMDIHPFAIALVDGKVVSVCMFKTYDGEDLQDGTVSWGEISFLATLPDMRKKGYAAAVICAAVHYIKEHTHSPSIGLYADTFEEDDGYCAVKMWRKCGFGEQPHKMADLVGDNGSRSVWMEGDIDGILQKIGGSRGHKCAVIDPGAYDAIRYNNGEFQLRYTYAKYKWSNFLIKDVLSDPGNIAWATAESVLRGMGILRSNVETAMSVRQKGRAVSLLAGARSHVEQISSHKVIAFRQTDIFETDSECTIKAAASGIHHYNQSLADKLMAFTTGERMKIGEISHSLRKLGVTTSKYGSGNKIMSLEKLGPDALFLAKVVDANGTTGHCICIDTGRAVIVDPANATEVPFVVIHR